MNFLFVVNGLGLGNSTRCKAVIDSLRESCVDIQIDILTAGRSREAFEYWNYKKLHVQDQLTYEDFSVIKTLYKNFSKILNNIKIQYNLISNNDYDLVITDSDYIMFLLKIFKPVKVVSINNSYQTVTYFKYLAFIDKIRCAKHFVFEILDFILVYLFSEKIICPVIKKTPTVLRKIFQVEPIVRNINRDADNSMNIGIFSTGALNFSSSDEYEKLKKQYLDKGYNVIGDKQSEKFTDSHDVLSKVSAIHSNSGMSTVSECLVYKIKGFLKPIDNHSEQYVNTYLYNNFRNESEYSNGVRIAAKLILDGNYASFC